MESLSGSGAGSGSFTGNGSQETPSMPLEVGKKAPDFTLPDENGEKVKLSHFKGKRVIVFFYPKAMTPG